MTFVGTKFCWTVAYFRPAVAPSHFTWYISSFLAAYIHLSSVILSTWSFHFLLNVLISVTLCVINVKFFSDFGIYFFH